MKILIQLWDLGQALQHPRVDPYVLWLFHGGTVFRYSHPVTLCFTNHREKVQQEIFPGLFLRLVSETALKLLLWGQWQLLFLPPEGFLPAVEIKYISLPCFPLNKSNAGCISSPCYLPDSDKWFDLFLQELELIRLIYKSPSYSFFLSLKNCTMLIFFQSFSSLSLLCRITKMNANSSLIASSSSFGSLDGVCQALSLWKFAHFITNHLLAK